MTLWKQTEAKAMCIRAKSQHSHQPRRRVNRETAQFCCLGHTYSVFSYLEKLCFNILTLQEKEFLQLELTSASCLANAISDNDLAEVVVNFLKSNQDRAAETFLKL